MNLLTEFVSFCRFFLRFWKCDLIIRHIMEIDWIFYFKMLFSLKNKQNSLRIKIFNSLIFVFVSIFPSASSAFTRMNRTLKVTTRLNLRQPPFLFTTVTQRWLRCVDSCLTFVWYRKWCDTYMYGTRIPILICASKVPKRNFRLKKKTK